MNDVVELLVAGLKASPVGLAPFIVLLGVIAVCMYYAYREFSVAKETANARLDGFNLRLSECERTVVKCDERTIMLSNKLSKIESSLESINESIVRVSTTLEMMLRREQK